MTVKTLVAVGVAVALAASSAPVYAREAGEMDDRRGALSEVKQTVEDTTGVADDTVKQAVDTAEQTVARRVAAQKEQIEARKAELEAKLRQRHAERKERLEGRRLAVCQNRETAINELLDKSASNGKEHLARIQRFEEGVKRFYDAKELTSAEYDAAVLVADEKEGEAIAALNVLDAQQFNCATLDGASPSSSIKESRETKQAALRAYRDSVIDLLHIVKATFAATQTSTSDEEAN